MKIQKLLILVGFSILLGSPAHALFELRASYGAQLSSASTDSLSGLSANPALPGVVGLGVDGIISLPLIPFGFGMRLENFGASVDAGTEKLEAKLNRVSALINYRLLDTIMHLGLIASVAMTNEGSVKIGGTTYDADLGLAATYSLGIEFNVGLLGFIVGGEAGYMAANLGQLKSAGGSSLGSMDLSGPYLKILAGFGF